MKISSKRTALLTMFIFIYFFGIKTAFAADLVMPTMYLPMGVETSESLLTEQGSLSLEHISTVRKYPSITSKKASWLTERIVQKSYSKPKSPYNFSQGIATSTYIFTDNKGSVSSKINIIANKDNLYLKFLTHSDTNVIGKWIEIPDSQYKEFGVKAEIATDLDVSIQDSTSASYRAAKKVSAAYKKHKFYKQSVLIDDGTITVPNSTRYDYLVDGAILVAFYKELSQTLTNEERPYTMLGIEGFEKALKDKKYITATVDHSSVSIWIDKTTLKPVFLYEVALFKDPLNKKEAYQIVQSTAFAKIKSAQVNLPKKFVKANEGSQLLSFSLSPSLEESFSFLEGQVKELSVTKSREDKSILASVIAYGYQAIGSNDKAAKYYILASTFAETELERFVYLAKAELALGRGKQAKDYLEKAYDIDPDDYFVQFAYGDFLNGNTVTSAPYKNINFALELNEGWEDELRDDENLQSLYVNYILLKQFKDAKKLEEKFDSFDYSINLMAIARAYHQIGDTKMSKKYQDLAAASGHIWLPEDSAFFALKFKNGKLQVK